MTDGEGRLIKQPLNHKSRSQVLLNIFKEGVMDKKTEATKKYLEEWKKNYKECKEAKCKFNLGYTCTRMAGCNKK